MIRGHPNIDAPPLMGLGRFGFVPGRRPLRFQLPVGLHQQLMREHQLQHAFLLDGLLVDKAQGGPDLAVAPERMLGLQCLNAGEQAFVPLEHPERAMPYQPKPSSLVFHARGNTVFG